ncbi:MAG: aminotransferase class I/II-fold pyridoxal phosphate-dependent enzyme [bacterium]
MDVQKSSFLQGLGGYAFAEVDKAKKNIIRQQGKGYLIDFGVGDPTDPTPPVAREAAAMHALNYPAEGYPSYSGEKFFRIAVARWFKKRFGVELDPETEITATLGSKQSVFCMPMAFVDPGDVVLVPDPGYPPYTTGALQRGGQPVFMPLGPENDFLPELDKIDPEDAKKARILWLNSPNNPTSKIIPRDYYEQAIEFCREHSILLCSDEAYSEMYYDGEPPVSLFNCEGGFEQGIVIHSLSKRSNMTNYRIGFVAGKKEYVDIYKEVQTNLHSGQAQILQKAATRAFSDENHVRTMRKMYLKRRDTLIPYLKNAGFGKIYAEGGFYIWAEVPPGLSSVETTRILLEEAGINTTPGKALGQIAKNGDKFVRFALIENLERLLAKTEELARKYKSLPMMARTHGQPATPTTVGKEFVNFAWRLRHETETLARIPVRAKINGASGNYNAHHFVFPGTDWISASGRFMENYLGLDPVLYTTQVNPNNYLAEILHCMVRCAAVITDLDRDMWGYISLRYFRQKLRDTEVGSSTMPHKVNPIDFENSEGNAGLAVSMMEHMAVKLMISRFQRDLSDSTVLRNLGAVFGYMFIALKSTLKGLDRIEADEQTIAADLEANPELLAEPVQTAMRACGESEPYEKLKKLTRGRRITRQELASFVDSLECFGPEMKKRIRELEVSRYTGLAESLVERYFREL